MTKCKIHGQEQAKARFDIKQLKTGVPSSVARNGNALVYGRSCESADLLVSHCDDPVSYPDDPTWCVACAEEVGMLPEDREDREDAMDGAVPITGFTRELLYGRNTDSWLPLHRTDGSGYDNDLNCLVA